MSYIINSRNELIAETKEHHKSGLEVLFAYDSCKEAIDADRDKNLVNARWGKISNAKKYDKEASFSAAYATEINPGEFLI